uniref:Transcriptional regulator, PadR-like family n=1 Tax=Cyanothece sp. (strain PCC 7425 / ATCC 29141) TaxID=395961 RepID=B8HRZ4_CYAP4
MKFEDIYQFFRQPPPIYLSKEVAVCYVLYVLVEQGDSYGTALIQSIETEHPLYRLSDTVLYNALKFLEDEDMITGYWKKVEGRGRPRRMYQVRPEKMEQARELANLWLKYISDESTFEKSAKARTSA